MVGIYSATFKTLRGSAENYLACIFSQHPVADQIEGLWIGMTHERVVLNKRADLSNAVRAQEFRTLRIH